MLKWKQQNSELKANMPQRREKKLEIEIYSISNTYMLQKTLFFKTLSAPRHPSDKDVRDCGKDPAPK